MSSTGVAAIVLSGGSGERFGRPGGKQLAPVAGWPVMSWSVMAMDRSEVDLIAVVCHPDRVDEYRAQAVEPLAIETPVVFAAGGATRQDSVAAGLALLPSTAEIVAVHDGARPLVLPDVVMEAIRAVRDDEGVSGAVVGHPAVDTLKTVEGGFVAATPDRDRLWVAQTPQVFRAAVLRDAHRRAAEEGYVGTDDSAVVERYGGRVIMVEGPRDNIKVTAPEDIAFVEAALRRRVEGE